MSSLFEFLKIDGEKPLTCRNIVFLLGAGASADAGIPVLNKIMEEYENKLRETEQEDKKQNTGNKDNEKIRRLYYYFKKQSSISAYSLNTSPNVEDILSMVNDYLFLGKEKKVYNIIGQWDKELIEITQGDISPVLAFKKHLEDFVIDKLSLEKEGKKKKQDEKLKYLFFLFYLQEQLGGILKIFTLNHDLTVEQAYQQYYSGLEANKPGTEFLFESGFGDKWEGDAGSKTEASFSIKNFTEEKTVRLFKMHGSIDWEKKGDMIVKSKEKKKDTMIVFGRSNKHTYDEPYSSLFNHYKSSIEDDKVKVLLIVGYAFNDKHINSTIKQAMLLNEKLKLIICDTSTCETYFFSLPEFLPGMEGEKTEDEQRDYIRENHFLRNIIKSEDYESYINISLMLHSIYYSRNFEEDALFLSACINQEPENTFLRYTKAGKQNIKYAAKILETILSKGLCNKPDDSKYSNLAETYTKAYLDKHGREAMVQNRNAIIYNEIMRLNAPGMPATGETNIPGYSKIMALIGETKTKVYRFQKLLDAGTGNQGSSLPEEFLEVARQLHEKIDTASLPVYKQAALELIDDLRLIEMFISRFIPIHLSLLIGLIHNYENLDKKSIAGKGKIPEQIHTQIVIFEMYLKYNYLIEAIIIKITEGTDKEHVKQLLTDGYYNAFTDIIETHLDIKDQLNTINDFLKRVKREFLITDSEDCRKPDYRSLVKNSFEESFLTWADGIDISAAIAAEGKNGFHLNSVLHKIAKGSGERKMQVKVMLYSKALAKSMVDRLQHAERILGDAKSLLKMANDNDSKASENNELTKLLVRYIRRRQVHDSPGYNLKTGSGFPHISMVKIKGKEFFDDQFSGAEFTEIQNKISMNLDWYFRRYYQILKHLADQLLTVRFDDPQRNFCNNLIVYYKLFNKLDELDSAIARKNIEALYGKDTLPLLFKLGNEDGDNYFERISFHHFKASVFFSKWLRPGNIFKNYYSRFYAEEYIRTFGDVNRMLVSRMEPVEDTNPH